MGGKSGAAGELKWGEGGGGCRQASLDVYGSCRLATFLIYIYITLIVPKSEIPAPQNWSPGGCTACKRVRSVRTGSELVALIHLDSP